MVHGPVEEALDLGGVEVDGEDAVGPGALEQVGHEARRYGLAPAVLLVLARVRVERQHDGDALGRAALERVDHDERLHDPFVDRRGHGLHHEGVAAAHRLLIADEELAVGEGVGAHGRRCDPEMLAYLLGQLRVTAPGEQHEHLGVDSGHARHGDGSPIVVT